MTDSDCPECGAKLEEGKTCRDYFEQMIAWDFEDFQGAGKVHHITVLSYNLQHPSVYSKKGLDDAKKSLIRFLDSPDSFEEHDKINRQALSSSVRNWKITGTTEDHGKYESMPHWEMTGPDVARAGRKEYVENVKRWGAYVLAALEKMGLE